MRDKRRWLLLALVLLGGLGGLGGGRTTAQEAERFFPETNHVVRGRFLQYWTDHGGLAQQGYPISEAFSEVSLTDGKAYTVQYFERAVFEYHPEYAGTPYEVLLSLVGVDAYAAKYPQGAPAQRPHPEGRLFPQTGHKLGGSFLEYWQSHGGLAQQGYPISDEFTEISALDQQPYTVQYFERAVFEYHPEHKGTAYEVLLAQLGTYRQRVRYPGLPPAPTPGGAPPPGPTPPLLSPTPGPGGLALPAPLAGHTQRSPHGSDRYLVWQENTGTSVEGETTLRSLDLLTQQTLSLATLSSDYVSSALDGSLVVWDEPEPGCTVPCRGGDVRGKDLATGQTFAVATGPGQQYGPALNGRTVAWVDVHNNQAHLMLKDLDTPTVTVLTTTTYDSSPYAYDYIGEIFISPQYVVWAVMSGWSAGSNPTSYAQLQAYDRHTGAIQNVAGYGGGPYDHGPRLNGYALAGEQLVWIAGGLQYANLRTGEQRELLPEPATSGGMQAGLQDFRAGTILWTMGAAVYGSRLDHPAAVRLVNLSSGGTQATLAGEWLVWNTCNETACGPLQAARLATLFAGALTP